MTEHERYDLSGRIPVDSDAYGPTGIDRSRRPVFLRPASVGLVVAGGTVGTALREALSLLVPSADGVAVVIVAINVVGAFTLGLLLETLARSGDDTGGRRNLRLLLGTGVLGGFTTYSTLATETALLVSADRVGAALTYSLGTVVVGAVATLLGIAAGAATHRRRATRSSEGARR